MKFVLGLAIGVALGLVLAPASSEETRTQLKQKARDFTRYRERQAPEREVGTATEQKAGEIGGRVGRDVGQAAVKAMPAKSSVRTNRARNKNKQGQRA